MEKSQIQQLISTTKQSLFNSIIKYFRITSDFHLSVINKPQISTVLETIDQYHDRYLKTFDSDWKILDTLARVDRVYDRFKMSLVPLTIISKHQRLWGLLHRLVNWYSCLIKRLLFQNVDDLLIPDEIAELLEDEFLSRMAKISQILDELGSCFYKVFDLRAKQLECH